MLGSSTGTTPSAGETLFGFDELIYSRTDDRGVIQSGNATFQRLCEIPWPELVGAPHRIIRHPDMPKGFFHLFWSLLKRGLPVAGYVKNRQAGGGYYWVLAAAAPCDGGYFSIRLRPSSPLFETMKTEYATLRREEEEENLSPEASAERLLSRLQALGFENYVHFAARALSVEISAREVQLGRKVADNEETLNALLQNLAETVKEKGTLGGQFVDLELLPVNMRLDAARLEMRGGPISQIAVNYKLSSDEIARRLDSMVSGEGNIIGELFERACQCLTLSGYKRLQQELATHKDVVEAADAADERGMELQILTDLHIENESVIDASLAKAQTLSRSLSEASAEVRRMILGLDTIRILARVESRKSDESDAVLGPTINRIDEVQGSITGSLRRLTDQTRLINLGLAALDRHAGDAAGKGSVAAR
jgi:PAS fold